MPNYRRALVPGGCWFFTVNLLDRDSRLLVEHIDTLRDAVRDTRRRLPFHIDAMVVLPDHMHAVWTLPDGDRDFPLRWRLIKVGFSKSLSNREWRTRTRQARGERGIWQRRYWELSSAASATTPTTSTIAGITRSSTASSPTSRIGHTRHTIATIATTPDRSIERHSRLPSPGMSGEPDTASARRA